MTEYMLNSWIRFSHEAVGVVLPINFISSEPPGFAMGHAAADGEPPITCLDGSVVRRVVLSFHVDKERVTWQ